MADASTTPVPPSQGDNNDVVEEHNDQTNAENLSNSEKGEKAEWKIFLNLVGVDETGVKRLRGAEIHDIAAVKAFGQESSLEKTQQTERLKTFLSPLQFQKFLVIAHYLSSNQGNNKLEASSTMDTIARWNVKKFITRKRGRPRINPPPSDSDPPPAKRPRGRPRKDGLTSPPSNSGTDNYSQRRIKKKGWIGRPRIDGKRPGSVPIEKGPVGRPRKDGFLPGAAEAPRKRPLGPREKAPLLPLPPGVKRPRGRPRKDGLLPGTAPPQERPRKDGKSGSKSPSRKRKTASTPDQENKHRGHVYEIISRGPPTTKATNKLPGGVWPAGWTEIQKARRADGSGRFRRWVSPGGKLFRSILEVSEFLQALERHQGDEKAAYRATMDRSGSGGKKGTATNAEEEEGDGPSIAFARHGQDLTDKEVQELLEI